MPAIAAASHFPLRDAPGANYTQAREFFARSGFDDVTICRALELDSMGDFGRVNWDKLQLAGLPPALRWCIQVFARGLPADAAESKAVCGTGVFEAFLALGLLQAGRKNPSAVLCPVWLYPADGFVLASDRREDPEGEPYTPPEDVVFPAIYAGTLRFLKLLPEVRGGEALDLCGGSGVGALHLSRAARSAVNTDIAQRSVLFAEFNARLNGAAVENFAGDLYEPVADRQFDFISAHPPFVPATGQRMVYRDAGATGEDVTRRIVEGLPAHLRPGGTCVILCTACDTESEPLERRASGWLGEATKEFDLIFGLEKVLPVEDVVQSICKRGQPTQKTEAQQLLERLRSYGIRQFVYGALFFRRYAEAGSPAPCRVHLTPTGSAADFDRLLAWRRRCRQPHFLEWLAKSQPRPAPRLQLVARHVVQEGQLVPVEFVFSIEDGFQAALRPDSWVVPLLARLDGKKSVFDVYEDARLADELPAGFPLDAFLELVRRMIHMGLLEVPFSPPA